MINYFFGYCGRLGVICRNTGDCMMLQCLQRQASRIHKNVAFGPF